MSIKMQAPAGFAGNSINGLSSNTYPVAADGVVTVTDNRDAPGLIEAGFTVIGADIGGRDNFVATTDPTVANDNTQDYAPGSVWFNTAQSRVWMCLSAATGAAIWAIDGVVPGVGAEPSNMLDQFGGSPLGSAMGVLYEEGNIYRGVGNPLGANGATTGLYLLGGIVLPAGAFDISGRGLNITAQGSTGATTNNKRAQIILNPTLVGVTNTNGVLSGGTVSGGTVLADTGAWVNGTTPNSAVGWQLIADIYKYGAAGSNTQYTQGSPILGTVHGGVSPPVMTTAPENAPITLALVGSSYTSGAAGDVLAQLLQVNGLN